jgi:hypothetical protein
MTIMAVLSTWSPCKARCRGRLRVVAGTKLPVTASGVLGRPLATITVTNKGPNAITIIALKFQLGDGRRLAKLPRGIGLSGISETTLPCSLGTGQSARSFQSYFEIGNALKNIGVTEKTRITPICIDSAGEVYKGKAWNVDPRNILMMS